jgi:hypothetical protein
MKMNEKYDKCQGTILLYWQYSLMISFLLRVILIAIFSSQLNQESKHVRRGSCRARS